MLRAVICLDMANRVIKCRHEVSSCLIFSLEAGVENEISVCDITVQNEWDQGRAEEIMLSQSRNLSPSFSDNWLFSFVTTLSASSTHDYNLLSYQHLSTGLSIQLRSFQWNLSEETCLYSIMINYQKVENENYKEFQSRVIKSELRYKGV